MTQILYCIEHEEMVGMEETNLGIGHAYSVQVDTDTPYILWDYEFCEFPLGFTFCPPPESLFDLILEADEDDVWERWCNENDPELQTDNLTRVFEFLP